MSIVFYAFSNEYATHSQVMSFQLIFNRFDIFFAGNCNSAIKDLESNTSIHFQVIPTTGTSSSVNSSAGSANNGARQHLNSNNSTLTLTPTPSSSSKTSTSTTASTALDKSQANLNFNNQSADSQIAVTTNGNSNATNSNHNQNNQLDNGQTNSLHLPSIVNHVRTATTAANHMVNAPIVTSTPPLVLSLSQVRSIMPFEMPSPIIKHTPHPFVYQLIYTITF